MWPHPTDKTVGYLALALEQALPINMKLHSLPMMGTVEVGQNLHLQGR